MACELYKLLSKKTLEMKGGARGSFEAFEGIAAAHNNHGRCDESMQLFFFSWDA